MSSNYQYITHSKDYHHQLRHRNYKIHDPHQIEVIRINRFYLFVKSCLEHLELNF